MQSFIERTCTDFEKADYYSRIRDLTGFDLSHQSANIPAPKKELQPILLFLFYRK